jgi:hypothetical protein
MNQPKIKSIVAGILMIAASVGVAHAQTSDALLKKLVDKGILTTQEADQLKKETDNTKTVTPGNSMPEWVTGLKLYADVRARYDSIYFENDDPGGNNVDRQRFRLRVRAGFTATFKDNLELGFRLISSDTDNGSSGSLGQGGNPLSGNATFQNNGSKKYAFIDAAYGKWSPIKNDEWTVSLTAGKMDNPFTFSDLVWDNDYTPEGAAAQISYKLDNVHSFKITGAGFVIDEVNQGVAASSDPWLVAVQARWDAKWTKQIETTLGVAAMSFSDTENLGNGAVPNINIGNTRNAAGLLVHNYNPLIADAGVTYWLEKTPLYPGRFPIRVFGSVMHNPSASSKTTRSKPVSVSAKRERNTRGNSPIAIAIWRPIQSTKNFQTTTSEPTTWRACPDPAERPVLRARVTVQARMSAAIPSKPATRPSTRCSLASPISALTSSTR